VGFDPLSEYPLGERRPDLVTTPSGLPLEEVTLEALRAGTLRGEDLQATPETLRRQAAVALAAGHAQLAANLERAAELALLPAETILAIYTALRPGRSTAAQLEAWAQQLEESRALRCAQFVREAARVYAQRGLLAGERAAV
jgi:propanediol dehydratase small subunit